MVNQNLIITDNAFRLYVPHEFKRGQMLAPRSEELQNEKSEILYFLNLSHTWTRKDPLCVIQRVTEEAITPNLLLLK